MLVIATTARVYCIALICAVGLHYFSCSKIMTQCVNILRMRLVAGIALICNASVIDTLGLNLIFLNGEVMPQGFYVSVVVIIITTFTSMSCKTLRCTFGLHFKCGVCMTQFFNFSDFIMIADATITTINAVHLTGRRLGFSPSTILMPYRTLNLLTKKSKCCECARAQYKH